MLSEQKKLEAKVTLLKKYLESSEFEQTNYAKQLKAWRDQGAKEALRAAKVANVRRKPFIAPKPNFSAQHKIVQGCVTFSRKKVGYKVYIRRISMLITHLLKRIYELIRRTKNQY